MEKGTKEKRLTRATIFIPQFSTFYSKQLFNNHQFWNMSDWWMFDSSSLDFCTSFSKSGKVVEKLLLFQERKFGLALGQLCFCCMYMRVAFLSLLFPKWTIIWLVYMAFFPVFLLFICAQRKRLLRHTVSSEKEVEKWGILACKMHFA